MCAIRAWPELPSAGRCQIDIRSSLPRSASSHQSTTPTSTAAAASASTPSTCFPRPPRQRASCQGSRVVGRQAPLTFSFRVRRPPKGEWKPAVNLCTVLASIQLLYAPAEEREFFIDSRLVRIHFVIVMIRWTGLAPWEFEFPFPGSPTSTFLAPAESPALPQSA